MLRHALPRLILLAGLLSCRMAGAGALVAIADSAYTVPNQPVSISVLLNVQDAQTNQLAVLQVTAPAHGTASINPNSGPATSLFAALFQFAAAQLSNSVVKVANTNAYPWYTLTNGTWFTSPASEWTSGFFPGTLWYLYEQTGDVHFLAWAESWTAGIASQQYVTSTPDLGFMINNSFGAGYRLTQNPAYPPVVIQAARSVVAGCYNSAVGCVGEIWANNTLDVLIDWTMNLELLFRASTLSGDRSLYTNAYNSAQKIMLNHVRSDGSTFQLVTYNATTGALTGKGTGDGASDNSTWARGQAWGTYGFTMVYQQTGDLRFLNAAQRLADYFLANVPADYVPYWDFQAPGIPNAPKDSSSAAITLAALIQLSQVATNLQDSARYWNAASKIFDSLSSTNYLAKGPPSGGILLHGTGESPRDLYPQIDVSLTYGDYYFIEAMRRYTALYGQTTITYKPSINFQGTDTFTYQACDSAGNCATNTVTVNVDPAWTNALVEQISLSPETQLPVISFPGVPGQQYYVQYCGNCQVSGAWNNLATDLAGSGAIISVTDTNPAAQRFYRVGVQALPAVAQTLSLQATQGIVASPFIITNGCVFQPLETGVTAGGRAAYNFTIASAGDYVIQALVNAPDDAANSFYVNVDAEPQDPYMIWDVLLSSGFEQRVISWRGNGTFDNDQYVPHVFNLTQGSHQLIIRGREAYTLLRSMTILPYP